MTASSSINSNAFSFLSFVNTGTDPRTGLYTCGLSLPELNGNDLSGPSVPLRLGYSPLNTTDSGFGKGWNLQLTQYDTRTKIVSLASGETFKVTSTSSDSDLLLMDEQKLDSFRLHQLDAGHFRVVHKSGLVEELSTAGNDPIALPERMLSPQGRFVTLSYVNFGGGRLLKSIANADRSLLLDITRGSSVQVRLHPNSAWETLFSLILQGSDSRVARIELPTSNLASWRFAYELHHGLLCISRVEGPLGGHEQIFHGDSHLFPGDGNRRLPRVTRHLHDPGAGQPPIDTRYEYDSNNFLGRNAPGLTWSDDGKDNLYRVLSNYTYWTTEKLWDPDPDADAPRRTITRTFNRFHLAIEELTEQGDCVKRVSTDYHIEAGKTFEDQPAQCQLPSRITSAWYLKSLPGRVREDVERHAYDEHGNQTLLEQASGIREVSEYYPAGGEDGCPPSPHGFVRYLKSKTMTPATADFDDAPSLRSTYRYSEQPPITGGSHPWLAQELETLTQVQGNVELQRTRQYYLDQPDDALLHGRVARSEVILDGKGTYTDFLYSKTAGRRADETVLRTTEVLSTSFDDASKTVTHERSLFHGETVLEMDDNDLEIAYRYDRLGRVIEETVAPQSNFSASRHYTYILVAVAGNQASQTAIDVKGVATRSDLDGLQRVIEEWRQDVDGDPVGKPFRKTLAARYDRFGKLAQSDEIDWLQARDLTLTTTYGYDDWNEQSRETGPDGVTSHSRNDPVNRHQRTWLESRDGELGDIRETTLNRFDKPVSLERFDRQGQRVSEEVLRYDGLGRCRQQIDALNRSTFYFFDAWSRVTRTVLPDATSIARAYAGHSSAELPVRLTRETDDEPVLLGEQRFDGLQRLTGLDVGPRSERWIYSGGQSRPSERRTAGGQSIFYEYNLLVSSSPTLLSAPDDTASYTYDRHDAQLSSAQNERGRREFEYDSSGHLSLEHWTEDGQTWSARYSHSRDGRQLSQEDVNGVQRHCDYDTFGRLERLTQGNLQVDYRYDAFSRPYSSTCRDLDAGTELVTTLAFDDFGRETERTLALTGQPAQSIILEYDLDDRLRSRHQRRAGTILLQEGFEYDDRGRLANYLCTGTQLPRDRYGNAIAAQSCTFDELDNLRQVHTRFADGSDDLSTRTFASDDPCQLVHVSHSHASYPPSLDLSYDADGNLRFDEDGRALHYDSQGRLLRVDSAGGQLLTQYHYDAHNQLCGETRGDAAQTLRFYQGERLGCTVQGQTRISYLHEGDRPLGQQQVDQPQQTLLLLTGANRSVIGESQQQSLRETTYDAWGERSNEAMQCTLGFNGELREGATGWYLLGNGYRTYNPYLMCFHSVDSLSPFGPGGINPYMYCAGDPVNFRDPSGHFVQGTLGWIGLGLGVAGTALSFGAAGPAFAALMAGTASIGQAMTLLSITSGMVAIGAQTGSAFTGDKHTQRVLRTVAEGAGWVSLVSGLGGFWQRGWKWKPEKAPGSTRNSVSSAADDYGLNNINLKEAYNPLHTNNFSFGQKNSTIFKSHRTSSVTSLPAPSRSPVPSTPSASPTVSQPSSISSSSSRHSTRPDIDTGTPSPTTAPTSQQAAPPVKRGVSFSNEVNQQMDNIRDIGPDPVKKWPVVETRSANLTWNNISVSRVLTS